MCNPDYCQRIREVFEAEIWPQIANAVKDQTLHRLLQFLMDTRSPIEAKMAVNLTLVWEEFFEPLYLGGPLRSSFGLHNFGTEIAAQVRVGSVRPDFAIIRHWGGRQVKFAIECDGYPYHDACPKRATADKQRDRKIIAADYHVLRFSGSEINADAHGCALEVARQVDRKVRDLQSERDAV